MIMFMYLYVILPAASMVFGPSYEFPQFPCRPSVHGFKDSLIVFTSGYAVNWSSPY